MPPHPENAWQMQNEVEAWDDRPWLTGSFEAEQQLWTDASTAQQNLWTSGSHSQPNKIDKAMSLGNVKT